MSNCFNLRPYAALRGLWTKTNFNLTSLVGPKVFSLSNFSITNYFEHMEDRFENRYWGVGFLAGVQPSWYLCNWLSLYANIDGALVWGEFKGKKTDDYVITGTVESVQELITDIHNRSDRSLFRMLGILDLALGFRFERTFCCERYRFNFDLGWEHHILFNHGSRFKEQGQVFIVDDANELFRYSKGFEEAISDISMGGFTARLGFEF